MPEQEKENKREVWRKKFTKSFPLGMIGLKWMILFGMRAMQ
jgi:hypothetical protein